MKNKKIILMILTITFNSIWITGCWNYKEIDKLAIVAGIAIDKGTADKYKLTVEIVEISGEREFKTTSKLISTEGKTVFDAVRNGITVSGKRLYWSHTKVVIISREIAAEGIAGIIDWLNRDSETRSDSHILISRDKSAEDIFKGQNITEEVVSFQIDYMLTSQKNLNKAPNIEIWEFINDLETEGLSATAPVIGLKLVNGKKIPSVLGTAIFKKDKLIGFLNGDETRNLLFVKDKINKSILVMDGGKNDASTPVSLEIFNSNTKIKPVINGNDIKMIIDVKTVTAIDEIAGTENYIEDEGRKRLEKEAAEMLKKDINDLIKNVQTDYGVDIFGFGATLHENKPKAWIKVAENWEDIFKNLNVDVNVKVHIRNSATLSEPLKIGD